MKKKHSIYKLDKYVFIIASIYAGTFTEHTVFYRTYCVTAKESRCHQ